MTAVVSSLTVTASEANQFTPRAIEEQVDRDYPKVKQLSICDLDKLLEQGKPVRLLDVRSVAEYTVSHLAGAVRVEPLSRLDRTSYWPTRSDCANNYIVLYCSVGVRSSMMGQHFQKEFARLGALQVYNLRGGIFGWHNERRPLVNISGRTDYVHPYDEKYRNLILRERLVSYTPR